MKARISRRGDRPRSDDEIDLRAYALRKAGLRYPDIAAQVGLSIGFVHNLVAAIDRELEDSETRAW